jgi:predicted small lipoprotein YifL
MTAFRFTIALALAALLGACGIKGDLVHPNRPDIGAADVSKPASQEQTR